MLLYLATISIGTGIVFGLVPALRMSRIDLSSALKEGGQGAGAGARRRLFTNILVVAEVALLPNHRDFSSTRTLFGCVTMAGATEPDPLVLNSIAYPGNLFSVNSVPVIGNNSNQ